MPADQLPSFSAAFNSRFSFGKDAKLTGQFGTNVLDSLIDGIDDFRAAAASERPSPRRPGPAMLGAFMWLDDPELLARIAGFPHASVAFTKQPRPFRPDKLARLRDVLDRSRGFPAKALPELAWLMPVDEDGEVPIVGPYSHPPNVQLPALRTIGYRRTAGGKLVPILHAKLVLLGDLRWHDEDEFGIADVLAFWPRRLWVGSANGTFSSRSSLEFGCWLSEPELLSKALRFLAQVLRHSEDLDPDSDVVEPDLVDPEFDDEAMAEAAHFDGPDEEQDWP